MDTYALFFVIVLMVLAAVDLTVGVANDAVNFLNSAIGSKAGRFKVIMTVAALGVLAGVLFSSGMMEVARKGIFKPQMFEMWELLVIFMAVMFTDVLLLDLFNTFGLPTSTTVSIVFGLLGGSFAVSLIKTIQNGTDASLIFSEYINSGKVIEIVSAIFLSIIVAFIFGSLLQYISRLIFSFDYEKNFRKYGSLWAGVALTFLSLFIVLKGAKSASFLQGGPNEWIKNNLGLLSVYLFVGWTVFLQLLMWFTKINILKLIVLMGTFALALAFAANDLVNFIGAPLAGLNAYNFAPDMTKLAGKVEAPVYLLLAAGMIMVITLYVNKKARTVTKTTINLGRQDEGLERFESNLVARAIVRTFIGIIQFIARISPESLKKFVRSRFDLTKYNPVPDAKGEVPAFDLIRASVNLIVSAAIISLATILKLPLSTTYVTFIVAMAAALPDKAWGRDSAVYRVSGVVTVVGGWFVTAMTASIVAATIAVIIYFGSIYAVIGLMALAAFVIYRSTSFHKSREKDFDEREMLMREKIDTAEKTIEFAFKRVAFYFSKVQNGLINTLEGITEHDLIKLRSSRKHARRLLNETDLVISDVLKVIQFSEGDDKLSGHLLAQTLGAIHKMAVDLNELASKNYKYVNNNHKELTPEQVTDLKAIAGHVKNVLGRTEEILAEFRFEELEDLKKTCKEFEKQTQKINKGQMKRIKTQPSSTRRSLLFLNTVDDATGLAEAAKDVAVACLEFYEDARKKVIKPLMKKNDTPTEQNVESTEIQK